MRGFLCLTLGLGALVLGANIPRVAVAQQAPTTLPTVSAPTGGEVTTITVPTGNRALFKIARDKPKAVRRSGSMASSHFRSIVRQLITVQY